jgi:TM2 domain-containing membrane protein YozV
MTALQRVLMLPVATVALILFTGIAGECSDAQSPGLDCYRPEHILRFAEFLYKSGDYVRAAGEFERYLVMTGHAAGTDSTYYLLVKALFLGGAYGRCANLLGEFSHRYPASVLSGDVPLYRAIVEFRRGNYQEAIALAQTAGRPDSELERVVIGMSYLSVGDLAQASRWACEASPPGDGRGSSGAVHAGWDGILCESVHKAESLRMKRPWLAGGLATVLPGAGKVYCGRTYDGIYSLLVIGLTAWLACDGFEQDGAGSERGWVFGALSGTFYLGNIYGSVVAARLRNHDTYDDFLRGIQIDVTLP